MMWLPKPLIFMSRRGHVATLQQMLDHAQEIQQFSASKSLEDLRDDRLLQLALLRLLEIVGEAGTRIEPATREQYPEIPWSQIIGLRNRLIHGYDAVDLVIIWNIVAADVPQLVSNLESILNQHRS